MILWNFRNLEVVYSFRGDGFLGIKVLWRSLVGNSPEWDEFYGFIRDVGLEDVPCKGKKLSWFSSDGKLKSRIDYFLV